MNYIETGMDRKKSVMIMSEEHLDEIQATIATAISRGATLLEAQGVHRRSEKQVLLIVVNDQEFADIKQLIESIDPQAFVIASNVAEVLGRGFSYHPIE